MPELIPAEPGTPEWLAARRAGVTATDIVTILGLSRWDSVYSLFWRKMQQAPEPEDNDRFRLGRELEPYVVARWGEEHPDSCYDAGGPALWRSTDRPWQMATPDSVLYDGEAKVTVLGQEIKAAALTGVLEVKTWADADKPSWQDSPPPQVRAQVLWQMDIMDVAVGHVGVVFLPSGEFRSYAIEHDHIIGTRGVVHPPDGQTCDACTDLEIMRAAGEEFMARLRLELPPPDPDASMATLAAQRARFTRQPDKTAEVSRDLYLDWTAYDLAVKGAEEQKRRIEILLREQAGEASVLTVDGQPVARRIIVDAAVKAHTRHQDYLKRIDRKDGADD